MEVRRSEERGRRRGGSTGIRRTIFDGFVAATGISSIITRHNRCLTSPSFWPISDLEKVQRGQQTMFSLLTPTGVCVRVRVCVCARAHIGDGLLFVFPVFHRNTERHWSVPAYINPLCGQMGGNCWRQVCVSARVGVCWYIRVVVNVEKITLQIHSRP